MNRRSFLRLFGLGAAAGSVAVATQETDCRAFFRAYRQWWGRNRHLLMRQVMRPYPTSRLLLPDIPWIRAVRETMNKYEVATGRRPDTLTISPSQWARAGRPTEVLGMRVVPKIFCPQMSMYLSNGELT